MNHIPCSKSYAQRYILGALFSNSKVTLLGIDKDNISEDIKSAIRLLDEFGAKYEFVDDALKIDATKIFIQKHLFNGFKFNCGESGTLIRLLIPILASYRGTFVLTGKGSLEHRNLDSIAHTLADLCIFYNSNNGKVPIIISSLGDYHDRYEELTLDGKETSQYISGIIMSACFFEQKKRFKIVNCPSLEYVKITIDAMRRLGYDVDIDDNDYIHVNGRYYYQDEWCIEVEKDWSSAAAYIVEKMIEDDDRIEIDGIDFYSYQCDASIIDLTNSWYATFFNGLKMTMTRITNELSPFRFDCTNCPDLFPVVCALASTIKTGWSEVIGLDRLVNKESDRGQVMHDELKKYGINVYIKENSLFIKGVDNIIDTPYDSHNDHRIAMALMMIKNYYGLAIPDEDPCLDKSYPKFRKDIYKVYRHA
jgi:3-phosphoshikimate 1-carboxyvinyltransferase